MTASFGNIGNGYMFMIDNAHGEILAYPDTSYLYANTVGQPGYGPYGKTADELSTPQNDPNGQLKVCRPEYAK